MKCEKCDKPLSEEQVKRGARFCSRLCQRTWVKTFNKMVRHG